ncbi:MAG: hypothetical protein V7785_00115 [Bermanella sp.]
MKHNKLLCNGMRMKFIIICLISISMLSGCAITRFKELPNGDQKLVLLGWYMYWDDLAIKAKEKSLDICKDKKVLVKEEKRLQKKRGYTSVGGYYESVIPIYVLLFICINSKPTLHT